MRLVQRLEIDPSTGSGQGGQTVPLASARTHLALNAVGHGVFEAQGDWRGTEGQAARFLLGRGGSPLYPLLNGTVAEAHRLSAKSTRLVVRDAAAVLEVPARLFLRHPTPRDVLDALAAKTGLTFAAPEDAELMSRRLPFNTDPLLVAAALVMERDDRGRSLELPCLPALRPGMVVDLREEGFRFMIRAATFNGDRVRLEWSLT